MIKVVIHQEGITIVNIYAPNIGAPKHIKEILTYMKGIIDSSAIIVRVFNTPLSTMDSSSIQKNNKEILNLNYALE